ncbi:Pyridoxamine 5'-phosphate oxidase family protein [Citrus sinensis]|nr:Pyridoxamine 5'-phosphate oxidase family protein [Citrus sinensis]
MNNKSLVHFLQVLSLVLFFVVGTQDSVEGRLISTISKKPHPNDAAAYARWNVVSFSDGLPNEGSGVPYFYLTTLDPTARNALRDKRSSLAISEYPLGTCGERDPENPACAKITLTGKLVLVDVSTKEAEFAEHALFTKHPEMMDWPEDHNFQIFKLEIEDIFLINWFGGRKPLTVDQYLHTKM